MTVAPLVNTANAIQVAVKGESASRLAIQGSKVNFGDGSTTPVAAIDYLGSNQIGTPSAVSFRMGGGAWNNGHGKMGVYEFWVDSSGRHRIKSGAPANDTDGTIIGTQA